MKYLAGAMIRVALLPVPGFKPVGRVAPIYGSGLAVNRLAALGVPVSHGEMGAVAKKLWFIIPLVASAIGTFLIGERDK